MKSPTKKPTDAVALMKFVSDQMAQGDWQGRALAEVAFRAPDLGVAWPIDPKAGEHDSHLHETLSAIADMRSGSSDAEAAFWAGRLVGRLDEVWEKVILSRSAKTGANRSDHFYAIADDLFNRGVKPDQAYEQALKWWDKNRPTLTAPSKKAWEKHRNRL